MNNVKNHYMYLLNKNKYDKINDFKKKSIEQIYKEKINVIKQENPDFFKKENKIIKSNLQKPKSINFKLPDIKNNFKSKINYKYDTKKNFKQDVNQDVIQDVIQDVKPVNNFSSVQTNFYNNQYIPRKNSVYFTGNKKGLYSNNVNKGDNIGKRYEVKDKINQGAFGLVISCYDHKKKEDVAIKCPLKREYNQLINIEQNVYKKLGGSNENVINIKNFIKDSENGNDYLVMEKLGINLYDWIKKHKPNYTEIVLITNQLFSGIKFIHNKGIIHTDLKPENIAFVDDKLQKIKIVDLGNGMSISEVNSHNILQTRYFRAPEVILQLHKSKMMDIWSIGCIICELINRRPLFVGNTDSDQLYAYMEYLGCPPKHMVNSSRNRYHYFDYNNIPKMPYHRQLNSKKLENVIHDTYLLNLTKKCLKWEPSERNI